MLSQRVDVALRIQVSAAHSSLRGQQRWARCFRTAAAYRTSSHQPSTRQAARGSPSETKRSDSRPPSSSSLSLVDRLFPNASEYSSDKAATTSPPAKAREIPLLPLDDLIPKSLRSSSLRQKQIPVRKQHRPDHLDPEQWNKLAPGSLTAVLRLDNAAKNLTPADFHRLIPKAKGLESWKLSVGDIISIVPGRNIHDLSQQTTYTLLFTSPFSAQVFRRHAYTLYSIAKQYAPRMAQTDLPIPPGYMHNGIDVAEAIAAFTIGSPHQEFKLIQLKAPLTGHTAHMLAHGGPEVLLKRPDRMPFELRLTLDGPQVGKTVMRQVFVRSGMDRGAPWSDDPYNPFVINTWTSTTRHLEYWMENQAQGEAMSDSEKTWTKPPPVYVVGFATEAAAQSFMHHWHNKPLTSSDESLISYMGEVPPIVQVTTLW